MSNVIIGQSGGPTAVINSSLAGAIRPMPGVEPEILTRDLSVTLGVSLLLLVFGWPRGGRTDGRLSRPAGVLLLVAYAAYLFLLVRAALSA